MKWVKVVDVVAGAVVAPVVAVAVDRAEWVAPRRLGRPATASAPIAGTGCGTWQVSRATRNGVQSAVRR